jgi:hypothetical protein
VKVASIDVKGNMTVARFDNHINPLPCIKSKQLFVSARSCPSSCTNHFIVFTLTIVSKVAGWYNFYSNDYGADKNAATSSATLPVKHI